LHAPEPQQPQQPQRAPSSDEVVTVTLRHVLGFVTFATAFMFLMFFFLNRYVVYAFIALFAYGAFFSSAAIARAGLAAAAPALARAGRRVRCCGAALVVTAADCAAALIAAALVTTWLFNRCAPGTPLASQSASADVESRCLPPPLPPSPPARAHRSGL
jgi:hypothetical protein